MMNIHDIAGQFADDRGYQHDFPDILSKPFPALDGSQVMVSISYGVDSVAVYPIYEDGVIVRYVSEQDWSNTDNVFEDQECIMVRDYESREYSMLRKVIEIFGMDTALAIQKDFIELMELTTAD